MRWITPVVAVLWGLGCGEGGAPTGGSEVRGPATAETPARAPAPTVDTPPPETAAEVALAESPTVDLLANRYRLHLYRDGLVLTLASEGLRKYTREYRPPWGPLAEVDGVVGRVLGARRASLAFPLAAEEVRPTVARVRVHGLTRGQKLTLVVNGERLPAMRLTDGWQIVSTAVPAGALRAGENELRLEVARAGRAGKTRSHALWHSIELAPAPAGERAPARAGAADGSDDSRQDGPEHWPSLEPRADDALTGFARARLYLEIPDDGWLTVRTAGDQGLVVRASDGDARIERRLGAGEQRVDLSSLAGKLAWLELAGPPAARWHLPRIQVPAAPTRAVRSPKNVVLLVVDTLRSDRLRLYGDTRVRTPNLMRAAETGAVVFPYNQAASPSSPPSHAAIHSGSNPRVHGIGGDDARLAPGTPVLSAVLGAAGFHTAYIGNNSFAMGRWKREGQWDLFREPVFADKGIDCQPLMEETLAYLDERKRDGKRFFLSLLPLEPHVPYRFHEGITDRYYAGPYPPPIGKSPGSATISAITAGRLRMDEARWKQMHALYDGEVEHADRCFGMLWDGLAARELLGDTVVVLTSDHGEGMYEHGRMGHAWGHNAEVIDVPLVVFGATEPAAGEGGVVRANLTSGHMDIAPTILELVGVPVPDGMQGRSLVPVIARDGAPVPRVMVSEYGRSYALRSRGWHYIVGYGGDEALYDRTSDPTEQRDVRAEAPLALRFMRDVTGFYLAHRKDWRIRGWGDLDNHAPGFAIAVRGR